MILYKECQPRHTQSIAGKLRLGSRKKQRFRENTQVSTEKLASKAKSILELSI